MAADSTAGEFSNDSAAVRSWLIERIAEATGASPDGIDPALTFDQYGISSSEAISISGEMEDWSGLKLPPTLLYLHPSIDSLAEAVTSPAGVAPGAEFASAATTEQASVDGVMSADADEDPLCIIGMACRFPSGADTPDQFWRNLADGFDSAETVPAERWDAAARYAEDPDAPGTAYTTQGAFVSDIAGFDSAFFDISPREALRMDPQQRMLLEVVWQAVEDAGFPAAALRGTRTGIFIGMMAGSQYADLQVDREGQVCLDDPYFGVGSAASVVAGRLSYLLDIHGPALLVDTACSSSLVALHLAADSVRRGECDRAIVGGVSATIHPDTVRQACKMRMLAVDGACKTFDAAADGFLLGEGCGVVMVARRSEALARGAQILAIVRSTAVNQDGMTNGLTAPNGQAQVAVIREALTRAALTPGDIDYVEAHGSGTLLGDSIEMTALHDVFGANRTAERPLITGAVKTNVGHLVGASGMAGLIKTILAMQHRQIPANLHLRDRNPTIDWDRCPTVLPDRLIDWPQRQRPALAGISSFGWSGTNAHVILEAGPATPPSVPAEPDWQVLTLSARTVPALSAIAAGLLGHLATRPDADLARVAFTTQTGRSAMEQRTTVVARTVDDAVRELATVAADPAPRRSQRGRDVPVSLLLPGPGDQYAGMGREHYETDEVYRAAIDECASLVAGDLGLDLRGVLYPADSDQADSGPAGSAGDDLLRMLGRSTDEPAPNASALFDRADVAHAAVFATDYACARLWQHRGIEPVAMLGYSLGEYVAATLAGVLTLADALRLVVRRAQLVESTEPGAMVAIALPAPQASAYLQGEVCLAAVNGPLMSVVAGPTAQIDALAARLDAEDIMHRRLPTNRAMHSTLLEPVRDDLAALAATVDLHAPTIPFISNVTGTWITDEQARDPQYWAEHMCRTVQFAGGVAAVADRFSSMLLETGPGQLSSMATQVLAQRGTDASIAVPGLRTGSSPATDREHLARATARMWANGARVHWRALHNAASGVLTALPTYPFEHQRFWPEASAAAVLPAAHEKPVPGLELHAPVWRSTSAPGFAAVHGPHLVVGGTDIADLLSAHPTIAAGGVIRVAAGDAFVRTGPSAFVVRPDAPEDYTSLFDALAAGGVVPRSVVHLWSAEGAGADLADRRARGFDSLVCLGRALAGHAPHGARMLVVTEGGQAVVAAEPVDPVAGLLAGPCLTLPQEYANLGCRTLDLTIRADPAAAVAAIVAELGWPGTDTTLAYRGARRWAHRYEPTTLPAGAPSVLRDGGTYLITGGLGSLGLAFAAHLGGRHRARLILAGRHGLPDRAEWPSIVAAGGAGAARIQAVLDLEAAGAEVMVAAVDVADEAALRSLRERIHARFGPVHGIIHAAGVTGADSFSTIEDLTPALVDVHFRSKVDGTIALAAAFADEPLDFGLLQSSMSSVLGGLGFTAYAAANAFLDRFVDARGPAGVWRSINWDTWRSTVSAPTGSALGASLVEFSFDTADGLDVFERALHGSGRVVVSAGDLAGRRRQWVSGSDPLSGGSTATPGSGALFARPDLGEAFVPAKTDYERKLVALWRDTLGITEVGINDNFFELGGNSLVGMQLLNSMKKDFGRTIPAVALFEAPTIANMVSYLMKDEIGQLSAGVEPAAVPVARTVPSAATGDIAIIGMAGRFPGAVDVDRFWENLRGGVESIRFFTDEELIDAGVPAEVVSAPNYVKARPVLDGIDQFDAEFFGYTPMEAKLTDPQHRLFLECVWEALENGGYAPRSYDGAIGVFAGANISTYLRMMYEDPAVLDMVNDYQIVISNDKDALTLSASYKLNLRGPSVSVQTFCSTSLVAVHMAARALLSGECEMAIAGGVSVRVPDLVGHHYQDGGMESPDGHIRTFDARAQGALFGDGCSVVLLKRLEDAIADGDTITAIIKGTAVNNDGSLKVGFTAPSVKGQADVISRALAVAGVHPDTVSYIEAHGTATPLGDPIEVSALTKAFGAATRTQYCAIGSVKTNVGHLDRAAGTTGLIKAALSLAHRQIPASLHYTSPNPDIDFEHSPFYVNTELSDWDSDEGVPRRAGVNSLGMGGTNVHVVLEEAPQPVPATPASGGLIVLSGRTAAALDQVTENLAGYLDRNPDVDLPDLAYTLQVGRERFEYRRAFVATDAADAARLLRGGVPQRVLDRRDRFTDRPLGLLLAGIGEQYPGLGAGLYAQPGVFHDTVDRCAELLKPALGGADIRDTLFTAPAADTGMDLRALMGRTEPDEPTEAAVRTAIAQPAVFVLEYALARHLTSCGLRPEALLGYSLGEYVAAALAGVMSIEDALALVAHRAALIDALPGGAMIAVPLAAASMPRWMGEDLDVAAVTGPDACVVAGPMEAIDDLWQRLLDAHIPARRLATTHAFHSRMLTPAAGALTTWIREHITLSAPRIPYLSNVTGTWIEPGQATDPGYWARHMCEPVQFAAAIGALLAEPERLLLEIGPGQSLGAMVRQHGDFTPDRTRLILPTMRAQNESVSDPELLLATLAKLWLNGAAVDWKGVHAGTRRLRIPLPTYPFQRKRYWIDTVPQQRGAARALAAPLDPGAALASLARNEPDDWFFVPTWAQTAPAAGASVPAASRWLILGDASGIGAAMATAVTDAGERAVLVSPGADYARTGPVSYAVRPARRADYLALLTDLLADDLTPTHIVYLPGLDAGASDDPDHLVHDVIALAQAAGEVGLTGASLALVTSGAFNVTGTDPVDPVAATLVGPARVIPLEYALTCRLIDVPATGTSAHLILDEVCDTTGAAMVALRGRRRWAPSWDRISADPAPAATDVFREDGVYLVTGGLGGVGMEMGRRLAEQARAKIVLLGRSGLPDADTWAALLSDPATPTELARRIRGVQDMRAAGAEVLVIAADIADPDEMTKAIHHIIGTFGRLDGVIHAAGLPGIGLMQFKDTAQVTDVLAPKIAGTRVLQSVLADVRLDFLILFSSIASITGGGPGQADYSAANAYLDACAQVSGLPYRVLTVNWGEWQWNAWDMALVGLDEAATQFLRDNRRRIGIEFDDGWQALLRAMAMDEPQVVICSQDLPELAALSASFSIATLVEVGREGRRSTQRHGRPDLSVSYVAPAGDLAVMVAELWGEALGITDVGVHDNFFELGGNSLLGVDLVTRIGAALGNRRVPPHVLYEAPTVAELVEFLDTTAGPDGTEGAQAGLARRAEQVGIGQR